MRCGMRPRLMWHFRWNKFNEQINDDDDNDDDDDGGWLWLPRPPGSASGNLYIYLSLPFLLSLEYTPTDITLISLVGAFYYFSC